MWGMGVGEGKKKKIPFPEGGQKIRAHRYWESNPGLGNENPKC